MKTIERIKFNNSMIETYQSLNDDFIWDRKQKIFLLVEENKELYKSLNQKRVKIKSTELKPVKQLSCMHFYGKKYESFEKEQEYYENNRDLINNL